jgi:hypothetical protein
VCFKNKVLTHFKRCVLLSMRKPVYIRSNTGLSPSLAQFSKLFLTNTTMSLRDEPNPRSLATTNGVSVDVLS